ncbi:MAG: SDR family oxidoreductase, partial [Fibrobacterota bacterium]
SVPYAASKGGVVSMTRGLARTYGPLGITVNAVVPGEVRTPMIGKTVKLPENVWKTLQSQARKQHTTVNSLIVHRLTAA